MTRETQQSNIQLANTNMVLDIVEQTLAVAHDLNATGSHVTNSLRELTGAHAIFLTIINNDTPDSHTLLAFSPKRREFLASTDLVQRLIRESKKYNKLEFIELKDINNNQNNIDTNEINNAVIAPLINSSHHIGNLIILGMPHGKEGSVRSLKAVNLLSNVLALIIQTAQLYKNQKDLISLLEKEICDRELAEKNLKNTVSQLIQTEKLVSIGQLAAGVAHEINSPLGAICSSNELISTNFKSIIDYVHNNCSSIEKYKPLVLEIIKYSQMGQPSYSSREIRQLKKSMQETMEQYDISNSYELTDLLTSVGIYNNYDQLMPLLKKSDKNEIVPLLKSIATIMQSNNIITMATKQSIRVVSALKNFSRSDEKSELVEFNIKDSIDTALTLYRNLLKYGIELKLDIDNAPTIYGYPEKLCQVWTNLIQNSAYAMNNSGTLEISLKQINDYIQVVIADSGTGIPNEIIDKIFDPLFTTKKMGEGTGLGLDIVKKIVEEHNGSISVKNKPNGGAAFTITLPIHRK